MEPVVEQLDLPAVYGRPRKRLAWKDVRERLEGALQYWVATTRPDGRPHVVPKDGVWLDDVFYFGGSDETVQHRNLLDNPATVVHVGAGMDAIIVEGESTLIRPSPELATRLAVAGQKYEELGYAPTAESYVQSDVWATSPRRVLAWNVLFQDATRFRFV